MKPRGSAPKRGAAGGKDPKGQTPASGSSANPRATRSLWWKTSAGHSLSLYVEDGRNWRKTMSVWEALQQTDSKELAELQQLVVPSHPIHGSDLIATRRTWLGEDVLAADGRTFLSNQAIPGESLKLGGTTLPLSLVRPSLAYG